MHTYKYIFLIIILVVGLMSCNSPDQDNDESSLVRATSAEPANRLWAEQVEEITQFGYTVQDGGLQISVWTGEQMIRYISNYGEFFIVIRALQDAILHVGLQAGDAVLAVESIDGTINVGAQPLFKTGDVEVFAYPGDDIPWQQVFNASDWPPEPTPEPEPTSEPEPTEEPEEPEEEVEEEYPEPVPPTDLPPCF